ncbi:unnamed protein product [Coregonus sp. 'balchen']|nr:unnamed protein product [Coregonus sp. 'balchen']
MKEIDKMSVYKDYFQPGTTIHQDSVSTYSENWGPVKVCCGSVETDWVMSSYTTDHERDSPASEYSAAHSHSSPKSPVGGLDESLGHQDMVQSRQPLHGVIQWL